MMARFSPATRLIPVLFLCLIAGAAGAHEEQIGEQPSTRDSANDQGAHAGPSDVRPGHQDRLPHPDPISEAEGDKERTQHDYRGDIPPRAQPQLPWLDAVRAQREQWEKKRRANKAAIDAHRRRIDPWGAARQEAREEETRRRREALKEEVERSREALRNRGGWAHPRDPSYQGPPPPVPRTGSEGTANVRPNPTYPPTGWDNPWYYQGH